MTQAEYEAACKRMDELTQESVWTVDQKGEFDELYLQVMAYDLAKQGDDDV